MVKLETDNSENARNKSTRFIVQGSRMIVDGALLMVCACSVGGTVFGLWAKKQRAF